MIELNDIKSNTVIVIAGPTASGKSGLALELAMRYNGVVINADSMQIYKGTPIISAVPTVEDRKKAEHLLYEIFEPEERGSVAEWLKLAIAAIRQVWQQGKLPIVVGGTGFYLESLIKGISPIPETKTEVKKQVTDLFLAVGQKGVYARLQKLDPEGALKVNPNDMTRVRRALEIFTDTGKSIVQWFEQPLIRMLPEADFRIIPLLPQLKDLEGKCGDRFDLMMQAGALQEVETLLKRKLDDDLPAMKAIGVPELAAYLQGKCSLEEAVSLAKIHTRQYAKRQLTWFRNRLGKLPGNFID